MFLNIKVSENIIKRFDFFFLEIKSDNIVKIFLEVDG